MPTIAETDAYVAQLFEGVTDKAGEPYIEHCRRVMNLLPPDAAEEERQAALLHDVIEDCGVNDRDLESHGYSASVISLVCTLTRYHGESYTAYVSRIAGSPAERIKRADLADNSNTERLAALPAGVRSRLKTKYGWALDILNYANRRQAS